MKVGAATDVGLVRHCNEDAYLVAADRGLFAVADGLGGHAAGDVASRLALETLDEELTADRLHDGVGPARLLTRSLASAHRAVEADTRGHPERSGMGTTAVVAHVSTNGDAAWLAHVGDSRAYLLDDGRLRQVTTDHTSSGPFMRSFITQALGASGDVSPTLEHVELADGDRLLLCTDGLTDMLDDGHIEAILVENRPAQESCDALVEAAKRQGGVDNVTVVVIDVGR